MQNNTLGENGRSLRVAFVPVVIFLVVPVVFLFVLFFFVWLLLEENIGHCAI